jgi:hypothetical protein
MRLQFFLLLFLCTTSLPAMAQFKRGNRMAGASVGSLFFNAGTGKVSYPAPTQGYTSRTTAIGLSLTPSLGWFITDKTVAGVTLTLNPATQKTTFEVTGTTYQQDQSNSFSTGAGVFARHYFSGSALVPFVQGGMNGGISTLTKEGFFFGGSGASAYKDLYEGNTAGGFFANGALMAGITKVINEYIGLDFFGGYNFSYHRNTLKTTTTRDLQNNGSVDLTLISEPSTNFTNQGFLAGVGFQLFLEKRK